MSLHNLTGAELLELRKRVTSAAIRFYELGSEYTRQQAALPELRTIELVRTWQGLRDSYAIAIAAAQEQFELLTDIAGEFSRRAYLKGMNLEGMTVEDTVRYIESGNADA